MCAKILETAGKLNMDEYNFFLRGGVVSRWEGTSQHGDHREDGSKCVVDSRVRAQSRRLPG